MSERRNEAVEFIGKLKHQRHLNIQKKIIRENLMGKRYQLRKVREQILQELPTEWLVAAVEFRIRFLNALEERLQGEIRFEQARIFTTQLEFLE